MQVTIVAGARPNFMKISPIIAAIELAAAKGRSIGYRLVHTGQHFDKKMSGDFFTELGIPEPDVNLGCGGGSQAEQTAAVMIEFEKELQVDRPDVVVVVGDVNSTMACTIAAKKLCLPVAHVEAGIRSGDMTMPEEINRIVTDSICDHFFTTSKQAGELLRKKGADPSSIHFVGNTMIDSLYRNIDRLHRPSLWDAEKLDDGSYYLLTLHRPANVDDSGRLSDFLNAILSNTGDRKVVFPVHPRTRKTLAAIGLRDGRLVETDPLGYLEFIYLLRSAKAVITDSGGITEEATVLNVPCLTLRDSTERPETIEIGTNELVGTNPQDVAPYLQRVERGDWKQGQIPELWDGRTSERIVQTLLELYANEGDAPHLLTTPADQKGTVEAFTGL
ncbi:MAG TPA: UDP-N-acetylglucosamine 2-epimerase (non-hydrolyzing) [Pyrinomonadaceae bacterium]|nr:UDP-N-acetylglucosamine 2-epimerase (non-hydrolyzing) [Pyrinomonadaceae bacterium]